MALEAERGAVGAVFEDDKVYGLEGWMGEAWAGALASPTSETPVGF